MLKNNWCQMPVPRSPFTELVAIYPGVDAGFIYGKPAELRERDQGLMWLLSGLITVMEKIDWRGGREEEAPPQRQGAGLVSRFRLTDWKWALSLALLESRFNPAEQRVWILCLRDSLWQQPHWARARDTNCSLATFLCLGPTIVQMQQPSRRRWIMKSCCPVSR